MPPRERVRVYGPRLRSNRTAQMLAPVPSPHVPEYDDRDQGGEAEPADAGPPVRDDDPGGEQRAHGASRVAADLEYRLRQPVASARRQTSDPRGLGMKNRG